jgi:hypothetical protein
MCWCRRHDGDGNDDTAVYQDGSGSYGDLQTGRSWGKAAAGYISELRYEARANYGRST